MAMFLVLVCVAMAAASDPAYDGYSKQHFHGMFQEACGKDGFYYKDQYSFVMCSNGNAYNQKCAPGSQNSGYGNYAKGTDYFLHDFCDVNMVDTGYNGYAPAHAPGYDKHAYPAPAPAAPKPSYELNKVVEKKVVKVVKPVPKLPQQPFVGKYSGSCSNDGFYYNNEESFVMCSNGNAYVQRCAPGSKNSGYNAYQSGNAYYYNDFCDVNLVDYGYAAQNAGYGHNAYPAYPTYNAYNAPAYYPSPRFYYMW